MVLSYAGLYVVDVHSVPSAAVELAMRVVLSVRAVITTRTPYNCPFSISTMQPPIPRNPSHRAHLAPGPLPPSPTLAPLLGTPRHSWGLPPTPADTS